jgi:hypothetical protein
LNRAALIRQAALFLDEASRDLDQGATPCERCGLNVKHNFAEATAAGFLASTITKLRRLADEFDERAQSAPKEKP